MCGNFILLSSQQLHVNAISIDLSVDCVEVEAPEVGWGSDSGVDGELHGSGTRDHWDVERGQEGRQDVPDPEGHARRHLSGKAGVVGQ